MTYRSYLFAALGLISPASVGLAQSYTRSEIGLPLLVLVAAALVLHLWLYARLVRGSMHGGAARRDLVLSGVLAAPLTLMMLTSEIWAAVPVFWVAAVTLTLTRRRDQLVLCLAAAAYVSVLIAVANPRPASWYAEHWYAPPLSVGGFFLVCWGLVYTNQYQRRIWELHQEAHAAREAQARLAVTEERLRFSRDLHDLLGHSLSLIAVKSELAMRLAERDPDRAHAEMADVRQAARDALREVRSAVRGYRAVELDAELAGVRSVLEAAGVRCETAAPPSGLPADVRSVLAWVIREGATNVIKHSEARRCAITLASYGGAVVLEMRNDGARPGAADGGRDGLSGGPGDGAGSGLTGLAERVAVVGGELSAAPDGRDGFLLRAVIPVGDPPAPAGAPEGAPVPAGGAP
ncbi:sensor histidine kinase [Actinomadura sp. J1-007]|nr:sensor histidine kinase [Actinomadura sp. J1-007]